MYLRMTPNDDIKIAMPRFEELHPEALRWASGYKRRFTEEPGHYSFWLMNKDDVVIGESLFEKHSDNSVLIDSFTVFPKHQGKGYGKQMIRMCIAELKPMGFEYMLGEARDGASIETFKSLGGQIVCPLTNWGGSGETYYSFVLKF